MNAPTGEPVVLLHKIRPHIQPWANALVSDGEWKAAQDLFELGKEIDAVLNAHPPVASTIHGQVRPVDETRDELAWKIAKRYGEPAEDGGLSLKSQPLLLRAVDALLSHPPVAQTKPVATLIAQAIEQARARGNEYVSSDKLTHILKLCDAHPPVAQPTDDWNAAIDAAEQTVADMVQGPDVAPTMRAVRRLKREPVAQPLPAEHPGHPYAYHGVPAAQPLPDPEILKQERAVGFREGYELALSRQVAQPLPAAIIARIREHHKVNGDDEWERGYQTACDEIVGDLRDGVVAQPLPDVRAFVDSVWATATAPQNDTTLEQLMKAFGERVIRAWVKR